MSRATDTISVVQKLDAEGDQWVTELARIGRAPLARLEWLLRFGEPERIQRLTDDQIAHLETAVYAFLGSAVGGGSGARPAKLEQDTLMRVVHQVRQGIRHFVAGRPWVFDIHALRAYVSRVPKGGIISGYHAPEGNWEGAFFMRARDLVAEHGVRIRRCARKGCPNPFVRRKGGLYCSKACSQKERTERMKLQLERRGESWRDRRHSYYVRNVTEKRGKAVGAKVRRRKTQGR